MKAVLIFSGGLDSTVLLHHLRAEGTEVRALTIDYGQRHRREIDAACELCRLAGVEHRVIDLRSVLPLLGGSSLTDPAIPVPKASYDVESMKVSVVPNRNMILLALAGAWAASSKSDAVAYAAHGGDHAIYPDCRPEFADAMDHALRLCDWHELCLLRPFATWDKAAIVCRGHELNVPFGLTWSCYEGGTRHCGRCGTCVERREAFKSTGIPDPTEYEA